MANAPTTIARVQTDDRNINQLQSNILTPLNNLLSNQVVNNNFLTGIKLSIGSNTFNHLLGRTQLGWIITDVNGVASIYRSAAFNNTTLTLNSSAAVTIDLMVF